ncbi:hypothetical protein AMK21_12595 [Streptomyces sp. CB00316]|uniref:hypothetical protein n=1 Tax=unclassified Streptomyces TaxID=2593676 RepID=UPI0009394D8C|nr:MULTISPECIES: hypothetical protein [unclassified Streptomyces]MBT2424313.1 hypothetical protein [Streptomyces sp. ISL-112]MBT2463633.1 hypothetical protein [Streptomyces sp. ISL-63]OKJ20775.1 hypothetical protein AMK21_12595 [Streptomyces sp. CB00316]
MIRNILGSLVALAGAASAVLSPFRDWYDGRAGRDYRVRDLFEGITATESGVLVSILLPFLFAALLVIAGVVLRSRLAVALAGLVVLGFTILWMVRQGQAAGSLTVGGDGAGLQVGVVNALAGGVLMLIGALLMRGRGRRAARREREPAEPYAAPPADQVDTWPPTQEPGMSTHTSPWPEPEVDPYTGPDPHDPRTRSYPQAPPGGPGDPRDPVHPPQRPPEG